MKRKKHMKLPNGFGHIKYLGERRRKPYGAYPPVTEWKGKSPVQTPALGYYETWEEAYQMLTAWHMEREGKIEVKRGVFLDHSPTFAECFELFYKEKYESGAKTYSDASRNSTRAAFKNCSAIHWKRMGELRYDDLQNVVNCCPLKKASIELIISLMHQMYAYALKRDLTDKDYSQFLYMPSAEDDEPGVPFSEDDLRLLREHDDDPVCRMLLILCFSGFRVKAYTDMEVNLEGMYFRGGVKTAASRDRTVPIHPCIADYVREQWDGSRNMLGCTAPAFRKSVYSTLDAIGIANAPTGEKHTPHDCRHTFSMLCEKYGVNENDRKRMMGHSFGSDITNAKYGHRSVEDLRNEIMKINVFGEA